MASIIADHTLALPRGETTSQPRAGGSTRAGPSDELRRLTAGVRAVVAMLCTLLLLATERDIGGVDVAVLLAYCLWSGAVLYREADGRVLWHPLLHYWIDVAWTLAVVHLFTSSALMVVTLVHPVVLATIGYGVRHGVVLALCAAAGLALEVGSGALSSNPLRLIAAFAVPALVPMSAVLSHPMSVLRQRLELVREIEDQLDPRRGLSAVVSTFVDALRRGTRADVVGVLLPHAASSLGMLCTAQDGSFSVGADVKTRLESAFDRLPSCPVSYVAPYAFGLLGGARTHGHHAAGNANAQDLTELAALLEVRMVIVVPILRFEHRHGYIVVGRRRPRARMQEVAALAAAAPDLFRLVEEAMLVDRLQEESAAHERVRIGRDLHDSAIQPYLGLKYAVEALAARVAADDPMRADIEALLELVGGEINELREIISGMRTNESRGDNPLVPAVRRQVRRFKQLFGIDVELECPDELHTSRALAGALFHMVNEAINNVRKHSAARRVWIALRCRADRIELHVRDDAGTRQGFAQPDFEPRSLMDRAAALGGSFMLHRPDALNTELVIVVPADAAAP